MGFLEVLRNIKSGLESIGSMASPPRQVQMSQMQMPVRRMPMRRTSPQKAIRQYRQNYQPEYNVDIDIMTGRPRYKRILPKERWTQ